MSPSISRDNERKRVRARPSGFDEDHQPTGKEAMSNERPELAQRRRLNTMFGERRLHLAALDAVIVADSEYGLASGVVRHGQADPVLNVIAMRRPGRSVEVGPDRVGGRLWFVTVPGGEAVVPVDEVERAPRVLAGILAREGDH